MVKSYYERKAAGLCVQCGLPAVQREDGTFHILCEYDKWVVKQRTAGVIVETNRLCRVSKEQKAEYGRASIRKLYHLRKQNGACVRCGKPIPDSQHARCEDCLFREKMRRIKK